MSTVLDYPTIETVPMPALAAPVSIKATVLAQFAATEASLQTLAAKYRDVAYNVSTPKGLAEAKEARRDLRENGRFLVERAEKRIKNEVNDLKRTMADEVDRLVAIVLPVEQAIDAQIKVREEAIAVEKAERERIEAERRAKHEQGIATIRGYLTRCQAPGMTAERIAAGIAALEAVSVGAEWEDYEVAATTAKGTTLVGMRDLYAAALVAEEDARQREAQRIENARIAAELAAERKRIADEAAEVKRQALELQRKINEQAEKEAKAERDAAAVLAAQRAESERLEALAVQQREAAEHAALEAERIAQLEAGAPKPGDDEPPVDSYLPVSAPAVQYAEPADPSPHEPRVTGSPEAVWLVYGDLEHDATHAECADSGEVTWCEDAQFPADVRYLRADLLYQQAREIAAQEVAAERERCIAICKAIAGEMTPAARMGALECWRVLALACATKEMT